MQRAQINVDVNGGSAQSLHDIKALTDNGLKAMLKRELLDICKANNIQRQGKTRNDDLVKLIMERRDQYLALDMQVGLALYCRVHTFRVLCHIGNPTYSMGLMLPNVQCTKT